MMNEYDISYGAPLVVKDGPHRTLDTVPDFHESGVVESSDIKSKTVAQRGAGEVFNTETTDLDVFSSEDEEE